MRQSLVGLATLLASDPLAFFRVQLPSSTAANLASRHSNPPLAAHPHHQSQGIDLRHRQGYEPLLIASAIGLSPQGPSRPSYSKCPGMKICSHLVVASRGCRLSSSLPAKSCFANHAVPSQSSRNYRYISQTSKSQPPARPRTPSCVSRCSWRGVATSHGQAAKSQAPPPPGKKKKAKGNPITDSLAPLDSIRLGDSAEPPSSPPKETKEERREAAVADRFFRRGYDFLYSADKLPSHPENQATPEVVVLGASNAGKSSFLNSLLGRTDAARVSSRPGHTVTMNAFGVGRLPRESASAPAGAAPARHGLVIVDTPGYGFRSRPDWGSSICRYVERRSMLRGAVVLVPAQKGLHAMDRWVLRMLAERNKRTLVLITKADMAGRDWWLGCDAVAREIRAEMRQLEKSLDNGWRAGDGWIPDVYATAAGWPRRRSVGSAPGMGGARRAILQHLAGFTLEERLEPRPDLVSYGGDMVSWDDLLDEEESR